jgi:hypothetical protein
VYLFCYEAYAFCVFHEGLINFEGGDKAEYGYGLGMCQLKKA